MVAKDRKVIVESKFGAAMVSIALVITTNTDKHKILAKTGEEEPSNLLLNRGQRTIVFAPGFDNEGKEIYDPGMHPKNVKLLSDAQNKITKGLKSSEGNEYNHDIW